MNSDEYFGNPLCQYCRLTLIFNCVTDFVTHYDKVDLKKVAHYYVRVFQNNLPVDVVNQAAERSSHSSVY